MQVILEQQDQQVLLVLVLLETLEQQAKMVPSGMMEQERPEQHAQEQLHRHQQRNAPSTPGRRG